MIVEYLSIVLVTINDTQMRMIADVFDRNTHVLQGWISHIPCSIPHAALQNEQILDSRGVW